MIECLLAIGDDRTLRRGRLRLRYPDRHTLLTNRMIPGSPTPSQALAVQMSSIEHVRRGQRLSPSPTYAETPSHGDCDRQGDEALLTVS